MSKTCGFETAEGVIGITAIGELDLQQFAVCVRAICWTSLFREALSVRRGRKTEAGSALRRSFLSISSEISRRVQRSDRAGTPSGRCNRHELKDRIAQAFKARYAPLPSLTISVSRSPLILTLNQRIVRFGNRPGHDLRASCRHFGSSCSNAGVASLSNSAVVVFRSTVPRCRIRQSAPNHAFSVSLEHSQVTFVVR